MSPSYNTGPFNMVFVHTAFGRVPTYGREYHHLGQGGSAKPVEAYFIVVDDPYQSFQRSDNTDWLLQDQTDAFRSVFQGKAKISKAKDL